MRYRTLSAALVAAAAAADSSHHGQLAFYLLFAAVPVVAAAALASFDRYLADSSRSLQALLWGPILFLVVIAAAVRLALPQLGTSAVTAAVGLFALKGIVAAIASLEGEAPRSVLR